MKYTVLLVDDEMPALRFVQSIIEKYAPGFSVLNACSSGESALAFLREHAVDVLITDISMHKMNGIELAMQAREILPGIRILIISGYAEFEYAQGAIKAAVDDYLLKPVSITQMTKTMSALRDRLDADRCAAAASLLPALACQQDLPREAVDRFGSAQEYRFAYVRWGGLDVRQADSLHATSLIEPVTGGVFALRGRDEEERLLIFPAGSLEDFLADLSVSMSQHGAFATWTCVYQNQTQPVASLGAFIPPALAMLRLSVIPGKHRILQLLPPAPPQTVPELPAPELKQLTYFITSGKQRNIKDYFVLLATSWERAELPEYQAWELVHQLTLHIAAALPALGSRCNAMIGSIADLFPCAASYGELLASVYATIFDDNNSQDRKLSTRDLYDFAVRYVDSHYAQPISMQSVCDELGISPTYLSRLFRKYSVTTFNAYLTQRRMEAAMSLLGERPNLLLRDVAACVGYDDPSYFSKVFHQFTGKTPSQYVTAQK